MHNLRARIPMMLHKNVAFLEVLALIGIFVAATPAAAHQLWIETAPVGKVSRQQKVHVCWGHSGAKETGEMLRKQQSKLRASVIGPDGKRQPLKLAPGGDDYTATMTPDAPGYYTIGAELQVGILNKELHGIPANTRIVMYGKKLVHVLGSEKGRNNQLGSDLEIVPVTDPGDLQPGRPVTAKVLFKGKPLTGRKIEISLQTTGPEETPEDAKVDSRQWSIRAHPTPPNAQVTFPLITGGQHQFYIRYFDETPGRYEGNLNENTPFSHLRKGDTYNRTMYVSTLTIDVKAR